MDNYSVVVRCKNESLWLHKTLTSLYSQSVIPSATIIVDNLSQDNSIDIAKQFPTKILNYPSDRPFNYSHALNIGISEVTTPLVLLLSAHCVIHGDKSIEKFLEIFDLFEPSGVFGRQLPTINSNAIDTRDLLTVFGRERIVYESKPFFHNAFSMISKKYWEQLHFDESVNGIEDRIWAQEMCNRGQKIIYEPKACVYHEHGLNQGADNARAERVCKALYRLHIDDIFSFPPDLIP